MGIICWELPLHGFFLKNDERVHNGNSMQQYGMERRQRKAAQHQNPAESRTENSPFLPSASAPVQEMAVIGALRAAVLASGIGFQRT